VGTKSRALVALSFAASGFAALVYQVAWQRILSFSTGIGVYSIALIVAAFMAGLGIGSEAGGRLSVRLGRPAALRAFAAVEVAIGAFGLASAPFYYDWMYLGLGGVAQPLRGLLDFASLAVPAVAMGASLPLLVRATVSDGAGAARRIGLLYGVNLVGAAAGALATPWVLVRTLGIPGALAVAAAANLAAAALALGARPATAAEETPAAAAPQGPAHPLGAWLALYALSGFCALGLEIVWFRLIDVTVKATAFTFGTVLAVYLAGMAAGTFAGLATVHRIRRPLAVFIAAQAAIVGYAAAAAVVVTSLPVGDAVREWIAEMSLAPSSYEEGARWQVGEVLALYALVPAVAYGLPTALMGYSFVVLQRAVQDDPRTSGRKVGLLQAANIGGCVLGSLVVGLGALTWIGSAGTLRALAVLGAVVALVGARVVWRPLAGAAALLLAPAAIGPGNDRLWERLHGFAHPVLVDEDATGVVVVAPDPAGWRMFVNGRSHSTLPFGGLHTTLGAAPALVHPAPARVAVIGLGSGDTAWAAACRPETAHVRVYEVCAPEVRLLRRLSRMADVPRLGAFLDDPRLEIRIADGRHALERSADTYDLIEMDALPPSSPYSGSLYSVEFFRLCRRRLRPGGVMCTWAPTPRVAASFAAAYPHVLEVADGRVLVGSLAPLPVDPATWTARLDRPEVKAYLGPLRADRVRAHLARARPGRASYGEVNTDLFPRDEFNAPADPPASGTRAGR
jgi:predicted membrane-bound spermidine synthase